MRPTTLQSRLSHRLRRAALAALTLLALLATLPPTPPVGANETAPTPPTWHYVGVWSGAVGLFERYASRFYVGRETSPIPQEVNGQVVNRPGPPDNSAPIGSPGVQWVNYQDQPDVMPVPGGRLQCPWPWERAQRGFFTYWSAGHWTKFATWSSQTVNGQTTWTKTGEFWTFLPASSACNDNHYVQPTPVPTRLPGQPTPTPLPPLAPNSRIPTPLPADTPNQECVVVPLPMRLTLRVSRDNGQTWTLYEYRHLGWRTDYTLDEYWAAQGGRLTLDDLPPGLASDLSMRFPHERTWLVPPAVQAGDLVEAVFHIDTMDILRGGALRGAYAAFDGNLAGQWRGFTIAIQEMGRDLSPGGNGENADDLLVWLITGTGGYNGEGPVADAPSVSGHWRDSQFHFQVFKQPLGFQALLDPRVTVHHPPVFTSYDQRSLPDGFSETSIPRASWPNETLRFLRPTGGYLPIDGLWQPQGTHPLRFRFRIEEGKMYRMLAMTGMRRPGCPPPGAGVYHPPGGAWTAGAFSQLAFGVPMRRDFLPLLDLRVERAGPDRIAVGTQADYAITVRNVSRDPVTSTTTLLTETLPLGVRILSVHDVTDPNNPQLVTNDATAPPMEQERGVDGPFQWRRWNLGELPQGAWRTLRVRITAEPQAPDSFTKRAETDPAPPQTDEDPTNNSADHQMRVLRANARAGISAPRLARPGDEFTVTARAINTTPQAPARDVRLRLTLPFGVTLVDAGGGTVIGEAVEWGVNQLNGGATLERTVRVRALREDEASALPAALDFVASVTTAAGYDSDPTDNEARGMTALLVVPRPQGDLRMRIHSEFDRTRQVYRTDGTAFTWPIGETLYFLPEVTLRAPATPNPPIYTVRQRVVAWSFVGSGEMTLNGTACRARETPLAAETAHADLSRMRGCVYRYRETVGPSEIVSQGRLYWAPFAPDGLASATYGIWPLPPSPTTIRIQYAVLVELVENGTYDLDEDGRSDSVLEQRTFVADGTYLTTLVAPRDAR